MTPARLLPRAVAALAAAGTLTLGLAACGDDDGTSATVPSTPAPSTTIPATTAPPSTNAPPSTAPPPTTAPDTEPGAAADAVDRYIEAIAAGDLQAAWALVDERSRDALGGFEAFEDLGSALSEGIGAWSGAEELAVREVPLGGGVAVVVLEGRVPLEGPPAPAAQAVLVRSRADGARVSPFERALPEDEAIRFDPEPGRSLQAGEPVTITLLAGRTVTAIVGSGAPTTIEPTQEIEGGAIYEVPVPAAPSGRQTVTVVVADDEGDRTAVAGLWPVVASLPAEEVAQRFVEAWTGADTEAMRALAEPTAVDQAQALGDAVGRQWALAGCEGAAGSVYCRFADVGEGGRDELVVRVANVQEPRLVTEVRLG